MWKTPLFGLIGAICFGQFTSTHSYDMNFNFIVASTHSYNMNFNLIVASFPFGLTKLLSSETHFTHGEERRNWIRLKTKSVLSQNTGSGF